jgi:hypothetical protein
MPKTGRKPVGIWNAKSDSSSFSVAIIFRDKDLHWFSHTLQPFRIPKTTVLPNILGTSLTSEVPERQLHRTSCATILRQPFFFVLEDRVSNKERSVYLILPNSLKTTDGFGESLQPSVLNPKFKNYLLWRIRITTLFQILF